MKVLIYDCAEDSPVGLSWQIGAALYRPFFDAVIAANSWISAFRQLANLVDERCETVKELHYWGHGTPGLPILNKEAFNPLASYSSVLKSMEPEGLVWFRCCSVFSKKEGIEFAKKLTGMFNLRFAAHTYIIGFPWHSGLHVVSPIKKPDWSQIEGVGAYGKQLWSRYGAKNTIMFCRNSVPELYLR